MINVLDSKEFRKTMRPVLSNKNTLFSHISIEENNRIVSDVFNLSDSLVLSLKMLLARSMSNQMNII